MGSLKEVHSGSEKDSEDDDNQSEGVPDTDEEAELPINEGLYTYNESNVGWSDSIANILKANKKPRKTLVLSKAKKKSTTIVAQLIPAGYQVATESGEIKKEHIKKEIPIKAPLPKKEKTELPIVRTKPNILDKNRERMLAKIATKGVVQLFNAVRMQQKNIIEKVNEAGPLEGKREQALKTINKKNFLNILMGKKSETVAEAEKDGLNKPITDSTWNILQNNYMMSAKLKDWDKELDKEVEMEAE